MFAFLCSLLRYTLEPRYRSTVAKCYLTGWSIAILGNDDVDKPRLGWIVRLIGLWIQEQDTIGMSLNLTTLTEI